MKNKKTSFFSFVNAFIIAGIIVLMIGLYYSFIKAGIPYQDPPLELQIQYEIDYQIGEILTKIGFITTICSAVIRTVLYLLHKTSSKINLEVNV